MIERTFWCDAEECEVHVTTARFRPESSFILVTEEGSEKHLHFCSWDCILKYAAAIEPSETIPLSP